jgi:hypothetical protein
MDERDRQSRNDALSLKRKSVLLLFGVSLRYGRQHRGRRYHLPPLDTAAERAA